MVLGRALVLELLPSVVFCIVILAILLVRGSSAFTAFEFEVHQGRAGILSGTVPG